MRAAVRLVILVLLTTTPGTGVVARQSLPISPPESVGMSTDRLARLTRVMDDSAKSREVAGTVTLVARVGRVVYLEAAGYRDIERGSPMAKDTIFRIASQSKAITSVGAMMLVEEGRLLLTDPVAKYSPGFANATVRGTGSGLTMNPVAAPRRITIRDLLTHTSGVSYRGEPDLESLYSDKGFTQWYFADKSEPIGHWIEKLATTRMFEPLKMHDTHFFLPPAKESRLATVYSRSLKTGLTRAPEGHPGQGQYVRGPRAAFSGGAGLLSTAHDYARFLQMMLNHGQLDGVRLLGPKTVELMTVNHIGGLYGSPGRGFGLGFETVDDFGRSGRYGSEGEFSWGGAYFSRYWVDPKEQLIAVFLAQLLPSGGSDLQEKLRVLVNQAIVGPPRGERVTTTAQRPP